MERHYVLLFDKIIEKKGSKGVAGLPATYLKSSGSILWDILSVRELPNEAVVITDSLSFPLVWYLFGKRAQFDIESERQLESILPAAMDGKTTRVRGRRKPTRKVRRPIRKEVSMRGIVALDIDSLDEDEKRAAVLWTARTQAFLRSGTIAWRKEDGIYTVDPVARKLVRLNVRNEVKLGYEWYQG